MSLALALARTLARIFCGAAPSLCASQPHAMLDQVDDAMFLFSAFVGPAT
tara:strand:- start:1145 stop:1294 length:150 start_codon:yes stop_codon:yes gene_type:complete